MNDLEIVQNRIKCKNCNEIIESKTVHDFVTCGCGRVSVDGGKDYLKRLFPTKPEECYIELSIHQPRGGVPVQKLPPGPEDPELTFDQGESFQDRYQPVKAASLQAAALQEGMHLGRREESGLDANYVRQQMLQYGEMLDAPRLNRALDRGEEWAKYVSIGNLTRLTNQQFMAMLWFYWGDMTHEEVGDQIGCSGDTARWHVSEAEKSLISIGKSQERS